jgi:hypothetical protein
MLKKLISIVKGVNRTWVLIYWQKWYSRTTTTVFRKRANGRLSLTNDFQGLQRRSPRKWWMASEVWRMIFKDYNDGFPEKGEWQTKSDEWYSRTATINSPLRATGKQSDKWYSRTTTTVFQKRLNGKLSLTNDIWGLQRPLCRKGRLADSLIKDSQRLKFITSKTNRKCFKIRIGLWDLGNN